MTESTSDFGVLLRRLRLKAKLSQEELSERSGVSVDAISRNERGLRWVPRRETIALLADALQLRGEAKAQFEGAALRKRDAAESTPIEPGNNLPWQPTSFVGRQREIEEISAKLAPRRLVTITGAGGIGKTRIALAVASRVSPSPRDGTWFVDLSAMSDGAFVLPKLCSILELQLPEQDDLLAAVVASLKTRQMLIILDNCEHILGPVRELAGAMLHMCPEITLLATSRERLRIGAEHTYRLSTLPVPTREVKTAADGRSYDALELFAERAATATQQFELSDENVAAVAHICRRLDGVALAIELAAARVPVFGVTEMQVQLKERFRMIVEGRHDIPARQQTLHATISWSHDLLNDAEQTLFRRLAIFASGWTIDAAKCVCSDSALPTTSVFEMLPSLVEKSLVVIDVDGATARYSFYESTRAYALERLDGSGETLWLSRRCAEWLAAFADRTYDLYDTQPKQRWEVAVRPELDNALATLEWAIATEGDAVLAGRISSGLRGLWQYTGLGAYGRRYVNTVLERLDMAEHPALVARLLLAQYQFLHGRERSDAMNRAIPLLERAGDRRTLARCHCALSYALAQIGRYADAEAASESASDLLHEEGLQRSSIYASLLCDRSSIFRMQGRLSDAIITLKEALSLASSLEDDWSMSLFQSVLAETEFSTGDIRSAVALGEEAVTSARRVHGAYQEACSLCNLACYYLVLGEVDAAEMNAREALTLARASNASVVHATVQHLAAVASLRGRAKSAARLLGYVNAWYDRIGCARDPIDQKSYEVLMESLRKQLSNEEISALAVAGAKLTEATAIDDAIGS